VTERIKYKTRNPYKPLRFAHGVQRAMEACPDWRMVTSRGSGFGGAWWTERCAGGGFMRHEGEAPVQSGVVCDEEWRPVRIETLAGRRLPVLHEAWEEAEA
jgi:hypothetical protein